MPHFILRRTSCVPFPVCTGMRVFYLNEKLQVKTHLLAVKHFDPEPTLGGERAGQLLFKWMMQVLRQFGLRESDIAGLTSDGGGTDITGVAGKTFLREWCVPHLLNRVTTAASGMTLDIKSSKNVAGRSLVEGMKEVYEHLNKSTGSTVRHPGCHP